AENRHARVQPAIDIEIPRGYQQQVRPFGCVFATELRKIHILANLKSPTSRRFIEQDSLMAWFFGLDARDEMMLVVVHFYSSVRRIKPGRIEGACRCFSNKAKVNRTVDCTRS